MPNPKPRRPSIYSKLMADPLQMAAIEDRGYETPCWVWQRRLDRQGYARVSRTESGRSRERLVHRVVYEEFVGAIPQNLDLDHLCRVRDCINPAHMEPVTRAVNLRRGSQAKLTVAEVLEIRASKGPAKPVASRYGISWRTVYEIRSGRRGVVA
jgi:hypothetical protein